MSLGHDLFFTFEFFSDEAGQRRNLTECWPFLVLGGREWKGTGALDLSLVLDNQDSFSLFHLEEKDLLRMVLSFQLLKKGVKIQHFEVDSVLPQDIWARGWAEGALTGRGLRLSLGPEADVPGGGPVSPARFPFPGSMHSLCSSLGFCDSSPAHGGQRL